MYDAIVVGARCAGSSTAMLLARKGYRVLLVDFSPHHFLVTNGEWRIVGTIIGGWEAWRTHIASFCAPKMVVQAMTQAIHGGRAFITEAVGPRQQLARDRNAAVIEPASWP